MLLPVAHIIDASGPRIKLAHLNGLDLRCAADGCHGIWLADGIAHQLWLPRASPDAAAFYGTFLPLDAFYELRSHAARLFWRAVEGRRPGPEFRIMPAQLRQWQILSLRALDARLRGCAARAIAPSPTYYSDSAARKRIGKSTRARTNPAVLSRAASR